MSSIRSSIHRLPLAPGTCTRKASVCQRPVPGRCRRCRSAANAQLQLNNMMNGAIRMAVQLPAVLDLTDIAAGTNDDIVPADDACCRML